jgi:hypothetical protein
MAVGAVVSIAVGVEDFAAATPAAAFAVVTEVTEAVTLEAASAEVIAAVTVAGDMDAVTATDVVGGMGLASG